VAPVAAVGVEFHRRVGDGELMFGGGQGRAFARVFALAAYRTFASVVHRGPLRGFLAAAIPLRNFTALACGV
jgi:hypothetical protein